MPPRRIAWWLISAAVVAFSLAPTGATAQTLPPGITLPKLPQGKGISYLKIPVSVEGFAESSFSVDGTITCGDRPAIRGRGEEKMRLQYASERPGTLRVLKIGKRISGIGTVVVSAPGTLTGDGWASVGGCGAGAFQIPSATCPGSPVKLGVNVLLTGREVQVSTAIPQDSASVTACAGILQGALDLLGETKARFPASRIAKVRTDDIVLKDNKSRSENLSFSAPGVSASGRSQTSARWKVVLGEVTKDPESKPGGPYRVQRGNSVTLDGSRSKTKHRPMRSYKWTFAPGPDCEGITPKRVTMEGKRVKIVPLCSLLATLEVTNAEGDDDKAEARVTVTPRKNGWKTPFNRRTQDGGAGAPSGAPQAIAINGGYAFAINGGLNESDCGPGEPGAAIVCPKPRSGTWLGGGYESAKVNNPGGPFDDFRYVASSKVEVKRVELVNRDLLPGSTFYQHNVEQMQADSLDPAGFVAAIRAHEGLGTSTAGTGHSQIIRDEVAKPTADFRRVLESLAAPSENELKKLADGKLKEIDNRIDLASNDPLPNIWTGRIEAYDSYRQKWIFGTLDVPGSIGG
jgi:hypothetical protein